MAPEKDPKVRTHGVAVFGQARVRTKGGPGVLGDTRGIFRTADEARRRNSPSELRPPPPARLAALQHRTEVRYVGGMRWPRVFAEALLDVRQLLGVREGVADEMEPWQALDGEDLRGPV